MPDVTAEDLLSRIQASKEPAKSAPSATELLERTGAETKPIFSSPLPQFSPIPGEGQEGPPREPLSQAGPTMLRGMRSTFRDAASDLPRVGREALQGAGSLVSNFFRALVPTESGARAGGEVVKQLGDIGTFASGGLMGGIGIPGEMTARGAPTGPMSGVAAPELRRGFGFGAAPRETPPAQLQLPPPKVDVPGRPPIETGPSRPVVQQGGPRFTPPPPTGLIPEGARGTMTAPSATPIQPQATRPGAAPAAKPTEPLIPHDAERGHPSPLASALLENDGATVDRKLSNRFRQATGSPRAGSQGELDIQDQRMTTAVDSIIANKDNIQFRDPKDPSGQTLLKPGQLPRNLSEFTQAIGYLKKQIFEAYDQMATRVTGQGAQVSLAPTVVKLRQWASSDAAGLSPAIRDQALRFADEFEQKGSYTPSAAQEVVKTLNAELGKFLNGHQTEAIYSHPSLMNEVRDTLLGSLNQTMTRALGGPQYQILRLRWGALESVEANVANALSRQLAKRGGPFARGLTTAEAGAALAGTLHGPVGAAVSGVAIGGARGLSRYLNSPNVAIRTMFNRRVSALTPTYSTTEDLSARVASGYSGPRLPPRLPAYVGPSGM